MDPILVLTYLTLSHYVFSIVSNIYDYIIFRENFESVLDEIRTLKNDIENLKTK
jgi:hypothetical protein